MGRRRLRIVRRAHPRAGTRGSIRSGPWHEVWLLSQEERDPSRWRELLGRRGPLRIPDALFMAMSDALRWVPVVNLGSSEGQWNLAQLAYGAARIEGEGARRLAKITAAWRDLLSVGPELLTVSGRGAGFDRLTGRRDEVVDLLSRWSAAAQGASEPMHYLLAFGV